MAPKGPVREVVVSFFPFKTPLLLFCFWFFFPLIILKANYAHYKKKNQKLSKQKDHKSITFIDDLKPLRNHYSLPPLKINGFVFYILLYNLLSLNVLHIFACRCISRMFSMASKCFTADQTWPWSLVFIQYNGEKFGKGIRNEPGLRNSSFQNQTI